jgi:thiosulfate/3-mercaptopyruvate sulfurtransferase
VRQTDGVTMVTAEALERLLAQPDPPTLLDARFTLTGEGRAAYEEGHLPGAVFADLDRGLCGPPGAGGRHPLPDPGVLQAELRRLGVRDAHPVVVYEQGGPVPVGSAARLWWTLTWAGHPDVQVLDGGYAEWLAHGFLITTEEPEPEAGDLHVQPDNLPAWNADDAGATDRTLIDARVAPRFRGETEPIDARAGHIPGAVNQPLSETVDERGRMLPKDELRKRFEALGVRDGKPVGAYCGSGITAAQTVLALHEAGFDPALYVGSWSDWITDPNRPVATGSSS